MAKLYRSSFDPLHWLVWSDDLGWARFPAKINGWTEHRMIRAIDGDKLSPVPLRLAFNTGLLESLHRRGLDRAS